MRVSGLAVYSTLGCMSVSRKLLEVTMSVAEYLEIVFQQIHRRIRYRLARQYDYKPRPDDTFLVTYPKSGTTLLQMMLYQMTTRGEMGFSHIDDVSPWFERALHLGRGEKLEKAPSPRFLKSHLSYEEVPRHGKIIYLARDVRDVAVSAYHHQRLLMGREGDLELFIDDFLVGHTGFGSWFEHIESWWPHRHDPNVLFLRYEEVVADLGGTVRKVARFCSIPVDEAELPRIVERCGFDFMKKHNNKFDPRMETTGEEFLRKGRTGEGRAGFTPEQSRRLGERIDELANRLGCSTEDADAPLLRLQLD